MTFSSRWRGVLLFAFAVVVAALPYLTGNLYYLHVATMIGVYWVLIATLNLLVGFTGQFSIGHVGLLAVGAYTFCLLTDSLAWHPYLSLLASGVLSALLGFGLGLPSLRLPGFYFAMVTLAFGFIVAELSVAERWLTKGSVGMPAPEFPAPFDTDQGFYWMVMVIACVVTWLTWNLSRLMPGRAMIALRDSPVAASSVAVPIYRTKLMIFVFSGFTAGIAGALFARSQSYITPDAFQVNLGIYFFVAIVIGGSGVIVAPFVGAVVLAAIPELVAPLSRYGTFFYGFILLVVVLLLPGGFDALFRSIMLRLRPAAPMQTRIEPDLEQLRRAIAAERRT